MDLGYRLELWPASFPQCSCRNIRNILRSPRHPERATCKSGVPPGNRELELLPPFSSSLNFSPCLVASISHGTEAGTDSAEHPVTNATTLNFTGGPFPGRVSFYRQGFGSRRARAHAHRRQFCPAMSGYAASYSRVRSSSLLQVVVAASDRA